MKRIAAVIALLLCLAGAMFVFTGCSDPTPITFNSVLSINADESGTRTITATADKATLDAIFGSKNTAFQHFLTVSCPDSMTWSHVETGRTYELTFTISFRSLEEYQNKVGALTGITDSVVITRPQVGVRAGFTLTESTDIVSLFSWLIDALKERTKTSEAKLRSLFLNGSNQLYYTNRDFEQSGNGLYIYAETLFNAECIDILTEVSYDDVWNRTVAIRFPVDMLENAVNVKPYLSSLLPEGVEESWQYDTIWQLKFPESTGKELTDLMNALFQSKQKGEVTEEVAAQNPMRITHHYTESLNVGFFVPNAEEAGIDEETGEPKTGETMVRYFVRDAGGAELSVPDPDTAIEMGKDGIQDYDGYTCLYIRKMAGGTFDYTASYQYQPLEINIDTTMISAQDFRRTTTLEMGTLPPEVHRKLILSSLKTLADSRGTVSDGETDGFYRITCRQSGTEDQINDGFSAMFGREAELSSRLGELHPFSKTIETAFSDHIDLTDFLARPEDTLLTYRLTLPKGKTIDGSSQLTRYTTNGVYQETVTFTQPNGLRLWLIAAAVFVGLFFLAVILNGPVRRYRLEKKRRARRQVSKRYPPKKKPQAPAKSRPSRTKAQGRNTSSQRSARNGRK